MTSWIDAFYSYTEHLTSPPLFRKWAAIAAVAGALERKVWVRTMGSNLYPNLYTVLVGPPGVGKTEVTWRVRDLWSSLEEHHIAASSVTSASLIDDLRDANRRLIMPERVPSIVQFNSLLICANELGVLIPAYENDFMNKLTDLYDCKPYSERRRTRDLNFSIDSPQINILAATTPSYMNHVIPEGAWDQGFMSRTILIYSGETQLRDLFVEEQGDTRAYEELKRWLADISQLYGKFTFSPRAAELVNNWHKSGGEPRPEHPRLSNYLTRRTVHVLKLCMIASAAESAELTIEERHFVQALDWLVEAEFFMPDIFKSMAAGGDSKVIEEAWYFAYTIYMKEGQKPIAEARILHFLQERTPAHNVLRILEVMTRSGILKEVLEPKIGKCYKPAAKKAH